MLILINCISIMGWTVMGIIYFLKPFDYVVPGWLAGIMAICIAINCVTSLLVLIDREMKKKKRSFQ